MNNNQDVVKKLQDMRSKQDHDPAGSTEATFNLPNAVDKEPTRRLNLMIPDSMHRQMKLEAAQTGVSMTEQVIHAWKTVRGL